MLPMKRYANGCPCESCTKGLRSFLLSSISADDYYHISADGMLHVACFCLFSLRGTGCYMYISISLKHHFSIDAEINSLAFHGCLASTYLT